MQTSQKLSSQPCRIHPKTTIHLCVSPLRVWIITMSWVAMAVAPTMLMTWKRSNRPHEVDVYDMKIYGKILSYLLFPIPWKTANVEKSTKITQWCSSRKSTVPVLFIYQKAYCINHAFQNYYSLKIKKISLKSKSPYFPTSPCHSNQSPSNAKETARPNPKLSCARPAWSQAFALTPNHRASPRKTQWDAWISCHHCQQHRWGCGNHHHKLRKWWCITSWNLDTFVVGDLWFVFFSTKNMTFLELTHGLPLKDFTTSTFQSFAPKTVVRLTPDVFFDRSAWHLRLGFQDRATSIQDVGFLLLNPHRWIFLSFFGGKGRTKKYQPTNQPTNQPTIQPRDEEKKIAPIFQQEFCYKPCHLVVKPNHWIPTTHKIYSTKLFGQSTDPPRCNLKILYNTMFSKYIVIQCYPSEIHKSWGFLLQYLPLTIINHHHLLILLFFVEKKDGTP